MERNRSLALASTVAILLAIVVISQDASAKSLYQEGTYRALTSDHKAHRVGDLLTVLVYENASASSTANTTATRDAHVGLDLDWNANRHGGNAQATNQLNGRGQTQREGKVIAQITVSVQSIAENGDLVIAGDQLLDVNNEQQQIRVEGKVRPQDVSDVNTVLSTRIADARISYAGEGDIADRQRSAWWQKVLTWFGL
jgi:flagellar L-ring protein precursor FlgH